MFYITDGIEANYLDADTKFNLDKFVNEKKFTVKDTPLTYRQINTLDEDNLLNIDRENKNGWRKFSFKELVFILLVKELKAFGVEHHQLRELSDYFTKHKYLSTLAIGCVLGHIEITITIDSEGKTDILDPIYYIILKTDKPHIELSLNDIVNKFAVKMGKSSFPIKYSIERAYKEWEMLPKEKELINIIRDKQYSSVTVKKKDGEISIVHAEKTKSVGDDLTEKGIIDILRARDFQDINIIKRDGKIVSHKVEETIRL
jgi:hypothetical protein